MNTLLALGITILCLVGIVVLALVATWISWIAAGSPDVNGEKERDAHGDDWREAFDARGSEPIASPPIASSLVTRCAWCLRFKTALGWTHDIIATGAPITDGICPECQSREMSKLFPHGEKTNAAVAASAALDGRTSAVGSHL